MFSGRLGLSVKGTASVLAFITLVILVGGRFFWPSTGSSWAAFLRCFVLLTVVFYFWNGARFWYRDGLSTALLVLFSCLMLNALFFANDMQSVRRLIFMSCFVLLVAFFWRESGRSRAFLAVVALLTAFFASFSMLSLYYLGELTFAYRGKPISTSGIRGFADFGGATITAGLYYAIGYIAALWLLLTTRNRYSMIIWSLCAAAIGAYIVMTFARTAWVACVLASLLLVMLSVRSQYWRRAITIVAVLMGLLLIFINNYLPYELNVRGLSHRDEVWKIVLSRMDGRWLLGHGAGAIIDPIPIADTFVKDTHNLYLEVAYHFGLVGLLPMVAALCLALRQLLYASFNEGRLKSESFGLAILAASTVIMFVDLNSFVDSPNLMWMWFWLPLGIALSASKGIYIKSDAAAASSGEVSEANGAGE